MFAFTKYSKIYYVFSGLLIISSIIALVAFGLEFGIEFTGGSVMQLEWQEQRPEQGKIEETMAQFNLGEISIQPLGEKGTVLQFKEVDQDAHQQIITKLNELGKAEETNFQYIGPTVGQELRNKAVIAIVVVLLAITLYIAVAFRKVWRPVSSWKYGLTSLIALFHDILIPLGVFSVLGHYYGVQITTPIVAALLTVLGFSVHDTIVIFDRIRENILKSRTESFRQTVDESLNQTVGRSLSTVFTTLVVMVFIFFFGGQTLKYFSLALIVGIASGAYSSIFIAGPLLVSWQRWSEKRKGA